MQTEIAAPYTPKRTGKKMICLGSEKKDRVSFIGFTKLLAQQGREILEDWKKGNIHLKYPLGLYPPSMPTCPLKPPPPQKAMGDKWAKWEACQRNRWHGVESFNTRNPGFPAGTQRSVYSSPIF